MKPLSVRILKLAWFKNGQNQVSYVRIFLTVTISQIPWGKFFETTFTHLYNLGMNAKLLKEDRLFFDR